MAHAGGDPLVEGQRVEVAAAEEVVLGQLAQAAAVLAGRQRGQHLGVAQHGGGLPEGADQVLALGQVHAGLAADGGVDLAEQRGGHVHDGHAPVVDGGGEPGDVGDEATADGHHGVGPGEAPLGELPAEVLDGGEASWPPRRRRMVKTRCSTPGVDLDADAGLGDDRDAPGRRPGMTPGQLVAGAVADEHVVGAVGRGGRGRRSRGGLPLLDGGDDLGDDVGDGTGRVDDHVGDLGVERRAGSRPCGESVPAGSPRRAAGGASPGRHPVDQHRRPAPGATPRCAARRSSARLAGSSTTPPAAAMTAGAAAARASASTSDSTARNAGSPSASKISRDRAAGAGLDQRVAVDEGPPEGVGQRAPDGGLARRPSSRRARRAPGGGARAGSRADLVGALALGGGVRVVEGQRLVPVERAPSASARARSRARSACVVTWRGSPRRCGPARRRSRRRTCAATSLASTSAIMVSATTPMAGTAVTSVRSLNETVASLVAVSTVAQHRAVEGGERLHGHVGHEHLAGGHAALEPAGHERWCGGTRRAVGVPDDGVVGLAPPPAGDVEAVAELDALDGLDAHERLGEEAVELAVPVDVAAEADGHAVGEHLDDAAERVAVLGRRLDLVDHARPRRRGRSSGPRRRRPRRGRRRRGAAPGRRGPGRAGPRGSTISVPSAASSALATAPGRDPGRGLAGRCPLEHVAGVVEVVLLHAGEVGVAGPGRGEAAGLVAPGAGDISSVHLSGRGPTRCWRSRWRPASRGCGRGGRRRRG